MTYGFLAMRCNQAPGPTPAPLYLAVAHNVAGGLMHFGVLFNSGQEFDSLDNMGNVSTGGNSRAEVSAWDAAGVYEWSGWNSSSGGKDVFVYDWATDLPVNIPDPSTLFDLSTINSLAVSPDGTKVAVTFGVSPYLRFFAISAGVITHIADPVTMPAASGVVSWSRDNRFCAVGKSAPNPLYIYDFNSGSPVKLSDPASLPSGNVDDLQFSPAFDYLTMSHSGTSKIKTYSYSGTTFTALSDPGTVPGGNSNCVKWSNTALRFSVGSSSTPWIQHYEISGSSQNKIANSATLPGASVASGEIAYSPDDSFCAVAGSGAGVNLIVYETAGNTAIAFNSGDAPTTAGNQVAFSPRAYESGYMLAASFSSGAELRLFNVQPALVSLLASDSTLSSVFGIAWRGE